MSAEASHSAPVIRICEPADAAALSLIGGATFLETYAHMIDAGDIVDHANGPHGIGYYAALLADPDTRCWLAVLPQTGAPVGYQVLSPPDLPMETGPGDIELKRIYVFSRYHGGGLARRFAETAIETARAMGKTRLLLGVYEHNERAQAFYRKMGLAEIGDRRFSVGAREFHDIVMARDL